MNEGNLFPHVVFAQLRERGMCSVRPASDRKAAPMSVDQKMSLGASDVYADCNRPKLFVPELHCSFLSCLADFRRAEHNFN
jgi:hypothetical protein